MSNQKQILDRCGCCEGIKPLTPASLENYPGLSALAYRVGTHGSFKKTMISALSKKPELGKLTTRDDDDPAVALLDAWAAVLDVLSFYQERLVNEGYLRTAVERRSLLELARHISYQLRPGVAAGTYLAFTMESAPGSPLTARLDTGTRAQSIPGQDELPQVFETIEEIEAKVAWNALKPRLTKPHQIGRGTTKLYLKGTDTRLQPGDAILLVGEDRKKRPLSERWDFRILQTVTKDDKKDYTLVTWEEDLGHKAPTVEPADNPRVFTFRRRAALFGHNAPDWRAMSDEIKKAYAGQDWARKKQWPGFAKSEDRRIYLDAVYPGIVEGSWIALVQPSYVELYKAVSIAFDSQTDFAMSAKSTRIDTDTGFHLNWFFQRRRDTVVFVQGEELELAEEPIFTPVFENNILLGRYLNDLEKGHKLIVSGRPLKKVEVAERKHIVRKGAAEVTEIEAPLYLVSEDGEDQVALEPGDVLEVVNMPVREEEGGGGITWQLTDRQGFSGFVKNADEGDFLPFEETKKETAGNTLGGQTGSDEIVSEFVTLEKTEGDEEFTGLVLAAQLENVYMRDTVTVNPNVARATHGETKTEVLGSGDGSKIFQEFQLKQKPLTFVPVTTAAGIETTLEIRVNDILWKEVPTFYKVSPGERVYVTRIADDGTVTVQFGDGITGARLPTGVENVKATYRVGIGLDALVKTGQISMLMTPALGLKGVVNPLAPTGAEDPETRDKARQNAPRTVLTMDRVVSFLDYENYANAYPGIGKARAALLWKGEQRIVHLTVAAANEGVVSADLSKSLTGSIDAARHPEHQVRVGSFRPLTFDVKARVLVDESYILENVLADVSAALKKAFAFDSRDFGQAVTPGEVTAVIQGVKGVTAVDLEKLDGKDPFSQEHFRLPSEIAHWDTNHEEIIAAELLTVNPNGIELLEMIT